MGAELRYATWAVEEKPTGTLVRQCGLRPAATMDPGAGREIDLAYHLTSALGSKGDATEVVIAVLAYAPTAVGLEGLMAVALPENVGSWRVTDKVGM
jgi:[ribosomal protein S5]-alanine N-acetyltransferase